MSNRLNDDDNDHVICTGSKYWKLDGNNIAAGYPRSISKDWGGLPDNIDAAFTWTNGKTYFFKGSRYWRFTDFTLDTIYHYPKDIKEGFAGIPANVDAAFVWSGNGKIYFFKGSLQSEFLCLFINLSKKINFLSRKSNNKMTGIYGYQQRFDRTDS